MNARRLIEAEVYDPGADHVMDYTEGTYEDWDGKYIPLRLLHLGESEHSFDYEVAEVGDDTAPEIMRWFAKFGVKDGTYKFEQRGKYVVGKWRDHQGKVSSMKLHAVDVGQDRPEWMWHMEWGYSTSLYRECWWPKLVDCVEDIMNDPIHCP